MTTPAPRDLPAQPGETARPLADLSTTGLLWLINRTVFHPRGYALALGVWSDDSINGWKLLGDGTEPWSYAADTDEDEKFRAVEAFLASLRAGSDLVADQ